MSAVAEYLKGKVDDSLTKLVQPAGVVPATLFVLLNLAFVYPQLAGEQVGFAVAFGSLDVTWQAVVVAAAILFLGFLLLGGGSTIVDLLSGDSWRGTWLYAELQRRAREQVRVKTFAVAPQAGSIEAVSEAWELRVAYPIKALTAQPPAALSDEQLADLGPNSLSNALRAAHLLIFERYGIDPVALWPQMDALADKDSTSATAVADAKSSLDTLANLTFVLLAFGVEGVVFHSARGAWGAALLSTIAFAAAYAAYRATVAKARAWGDATEVMFDLYRDKLRDGLKLRSVTSAADERELWQKTSQIFLWGRADVPEPDEIYEGQPAVVPTPATITASQSLSVARHREEPVELPRQGETGPVAGSFVEYMLVVTREADRPADGFIALTDDRIPRIDRPPQVKVLPRDATEPRGEIPDPEGAPGTLVWQLPHVSPGASFWLAFALPAWEVRVSDGLLVEATRAKEFVGLDVTVSASADVAADPWLEVFVGETTQMPKLLVLNHGRTAPRRPDVAGPAGRHRWTLAGSTFPIALRISFPKPSSHE